MRHTGFVSDWLLVSQVVGYTVSTVIVLLLAALVRRASRFEDASAYSLLVWSVLLWNAGNLVAAAGVLAGLPGEGFLVRASMIAAFGGAAMSPAGALIMWRRLESASPASRWLIRASCASGLLLSGWLLGQVVLRGPLEAEHALWRLLAYHVAGFFVVGAVVFTRGRRTTLPSRVGIGMAGLGALGVGMTVFLEKGIAVMQPHEEATLLEIGRQISTHVMTLGALVFLARFRFADVFIRRSLRMIAAVLLGIVCAGAVRYLSVTAAAESATRATAMVVIGGTLVIAALLLSFGFVDRLIVAIVDRWLFKQPDYDRALALLGAELAAQREPAALAECVAGLVRDTLSLERVRVTSVATTVSPDAVRLPVPAHDGVQRVLDATPRWDHPTLLDREVEFLRAAAALLGHRLDAVRQEQDEIDRLTREADLRRQVSEATLRALQAQVNPHFLFNTLNTIADLIQEDPAGAEAMTLRLAEVFSHVLTNSARPFSSVEEEMAFLRTYLTIEEARFGDRLRVDFVVDPAATHAIIPSLILQPAVENALKHGLSRKIGPGRLTISAFVEAGELRLSVEDDGVGPSTHRPEKTPADSLRTGPSTARRGEHGEPLRTGVGLRNIAERLHTLYAERASIRFEAASRGGSVVTVRLPLHAHDQEPVG